MPVIIIKKNSDGVSAFFCVLKLAGRRMLGPNDRF